MPDHNKLKRLLELLIYLSGSFGHSLQEIMERFGFTERTTYRYIKTIRETGIVLDLCKGFYKVNKYKGAGKDISKLLHFSEEEAWILSKAIHSIDDNNLVKHNLIKKLYSLYDFDRVAKAVIKKEHSENIHQIIEAIKTKRQILLREYKSANSSVIRDRLAEPVSFTTNFVSLWCYEPESRQNKLFKTARIKKVEIYDKNWQFEEFHKEGEVDVFRISSLESFPVKLRLSLRAANLLCEEYPLADKYIVSDNGRKYIFSANVCGYEGVGRFVLGLPGEVEVLETGEFKRYLRYRMTKSKSFVEG